MPRKSMASVALTCKHIDCNYIYIVCKQKQQSDTVNTMEILASWMCLRYVAQSHILTTTITLRKLKQRRGCSDA